jgi:hypothetical protein
LGYMVVTAAQGGVEWPRFLVERYGGVARLRGGRSDRLPASGSLSLAAVSTGRCNTTWW